MSGSVLSTPKQLAYNPHPVGVSQTGNFAFKVCPLDAVFGEVRRYDHQAADALTAALVDHLQHGLGGHGHEGQVHLAWDVADAGEARQAGDVRRRRVDGVDGALELTEHQVAYQLVAYRPGCPGGAYDGHGAGRSRRCIERAVAWRSRSYKADSASLVG